MLTPPAVQFQASNCPLDNVFKMPRQQLNMFGAELTSLLDSLAPRDLVHSSERHRRCVVGQGRERWPSLLMPGVGSLYLSPSHLLSSQVPLVFPPEDASHPSTSLPLQPWNGCLLPTAWEPATASWPVSLLLISLLPTPSSACPQACDHNWTTSLLKYLLLPR